MTKCPKCAYERTPQDDGIVSEAECPRCGAVYAKVVAARYAEAAGQSVQTVVAPRIGRRAVTVTLLAGVLAGGYAWFKIGSSTTPPLLDTGFIELPRLEEELPAGSVTIFGPT
jgi:hypothetical protein